jgi:hypothetical protein
VRPLAIVSREIRLEALARLVTGDVGLVVALVRGAAPGAAIAAFLLVNVVLGVIWAWRGQGRLRALAPVAPRADDEAELETPDATKRRVIKGIAPAFVAVVVLALVYPGAGAVIAGVPAGIGAGDLHLLGWLRRLERDREECFLRETPQSAFSGVRRPVYTRPISEVTAAT